MNMDTAVRLAFPLLAVPRAEPLPPATSNGTRYLVASDGLWREISLPWVSVRHCVALSALRLPYGQTAAEVDVRCGPIPPGVIRQFVTEARAASPREIAGAFFWHECTGLWRYERRHAFSDSGDHVHYQEVRPREDEHLVVDVHSHGLHAAFFSAEDDADDAGSMKFGLVLGNLDQAVPSSVMRLSMAGLVLDGVRLGATGELEVA